MVSISSKTYLAEQMPEGPWLYPEDQISDAPLRMLAAEITREKIYERLHEELPYQSTVETDQWRQEARRFDPHRANSVRGARQPAQDRARQARPDHQGHRTIRPARKSPRSPKRTVHLFLFVKVRENWGDDPERYREMGLEFPRGG